ncbi:hypothetical protein A3709_13605 [Halioglobus sp. HI00S01]|uniref:TonB-dependent receptor plug domain-containing protein n=1 Tax=Halioglobus sp. HI00S01 TaxID=1822214 RepID=UPI0007C33395|nr:TonB-dependent receptor plug domain-containing protein [Halioglobus sp. HI00S01]KZX59331.1 hypothetical protein A3709_13605 [Halioglobus sp. HI00S01]
MLKTVLACAVAASGVTAPQAIAQSERVALEEVIVTARNREESMQDVPVTVNSLTKDLNRSTVRSVRDVENYAPNVNIDRIADNSGASISIRGNSFQETDKSVDPPAGVVLDGMYMGVVAGGLLHNFDMERIEVLRGP